MDNGAFMHTFKMRELFITFNINSISYMVKDIRKYRKFNDKRNFAIHIFCVALEIIIDDIIENGVEFQFPNSNLGGASMFLQRITGRRFRAIRRNGAFKQFDPLETNFSAYRIEFRGEKKSGRNFTIPIHLDARRTARIAELARNNKIKVGKVKTYTDYYAIIEQKFPTISHMDIYKILRFGFNSFRSHIFFGADIGLKSPSIYMQTGLSFKKQNSMLKYVLKKMAIKIRIMYRRLHFLWDGYSYFTLCTSRFNAIKNDYYQHKVVDFGKVMLYKCPDEAFVRSHFGRALFKVKAGDESKKFANMEHIVTDEAELIEVFPKWNLNMLTFSQRKYMTLIPKTQSVQKIYTQNYPPYIKWLRARRWKTLRR